MNTRRIWGMMLRNWYVWIRDLDRIFDAFWWAFFDLATWGLMSSYFAKLYGSDNMMMLILTGVIFWSILARSQWEITVSMIIESWERNLINIFTTPITVAEFLASSILLGLGKLLLVLLFMAGVTLLFYQYNIFTALHWEIIPLLASLFLTCIWIALVVNALILRFGKQVISFAWTLVFIINPLSGVVYPISSLPPVLQTLAKFVPTSYVFEAMRRLLLTGTMDWGLVGISVVLNAGYVVLGVIVFFRTFRQARARGWLIKLA